MVGPIPEEALQRFELEESLNISQGFPASENFEFGESDGYLWLVVCVGELIRLLLMEAGREVLVGMYLKRKCFLDGKDLKWYRLR